MQIKDKIEGLCDIKNVYVFLMQEGQENAVPPISGKQIEDKLNGNVTYLRDSVNYNDNGTLSIITNCKGFVVKCDMDKLTKYPELDTYIKVVFMTLGQWIPAKLRGKDVDTLRLWSFKIVNGKILFN